MTFHLASTTLPPPFHHLPPEGATTPPLYPPGGGSTHHHRWNCGGRCHPHQTARCTVTVCVGIDPGSASGAVAWLHADGRAAGATPPAAHCRRARPARLARALLLDTPEPAAACYIELVGVMPRQGIASGFKFGRAVGAIHATCALTGLRLELVTPATWKRHHRLGADKEQARALALRRWPALADRLARKKDADRAEALLIADYGLRAIAEEARASSAIASGACKAVEARSRHQHKGTSR